MDLGKAVAAAGVSLPPVQPLNARRIQMSQADANVVAPLKMLFTLTQGKSRLVADPQGRAFFVVKNIKITPGNALSNPALIAQTQAAFQQTASDELGAQLLAAMKAEQGVKRNEEAIAASQAADHRVRQLEGRSCAVRDQAPNPRRRQYRQLHLHAGRLSRVARRGGGGRAE